MVESTVMHRANDGKIFSDEIAAHKHEVACKLSDSIISIFPDTSKLGRGDFYQLTPYMVEHAKTKFCGILKDRFKSDKMFHVAIDDFEEDTRNNFVGRLLCDSNSPLYKAWIIFESIDGQYRLYNQPYFAKYVHSSETTGKQIPID